MGVSSRDQSGRVVPLDASDRRSGLTPLGAQVGEAAFGHGHADIERGAVLGAVPFVGLSPLGLDNASFRPVLEHEVHHARYGVGTVLRGSAVAENLDPFNRDGGDDADVGTLGSRGDAVAEKRDDGGPVAPLSVNEDQGLVGRQAPHVGGTDERGGIAYGLRSDIVRGNHGTQEIGDIPGSLVGEVFAGNYVHRGGSVGGRVHMPARTHHRHLPERDLARIVQRPRGVRAGRQAEKQHARDRSDQAKKHPARKNAFRHFSHN